jgi:hypothetical protein
LKADSNSIDIRSLSKGKRSQANSSIKVKLPKTPRFCKERTKIFNCSVTSYPSNAVQNVCPYVKCKHHSVKVKTHYIEWERLEYTGIPCPTLQLFLMVVNFMSIMNSELKEMGEEVIMYF